MNREEVEKIVVEAREKGERPNLTGAYLRGANLRGADLAGADLTGAYLMRAYLAGADLTGAYLMRAYLTGADLAGANLSGANLMRANLSGANLSGANLRDAKNIPEYVSAATSIMPEGDIIGYKKFRDGLLGKLLIPAASKRSNATGRKCRAEYAQVLAIYDKDGKQYDSATSQHDKYFIYRVGETVRPDVWDDDRWNECSGGIHFFLTEYEAKEY